ncbi:mitochondrial import receptor subunit TOM70 [Mustela nigripes]|uniref:Mitochondrial import receptor subunit TOM70 n=3 Tax=Neovison vison TaxID=452646 RepID=A0A8C7BSE1_NEOVI|nr:mitochondrial import receptor subunit TOM70 [Mustela erminea]XP_032707930.1 mitochondrial import receptor subunit TOM70 [Lontra canadensis]XP_044107154.1 mitochondrial import receptor subunit TOM70 [Neogale vison]XP_059020333.1 mitochondrial import receptor subunit TOM70 [Mustela lutreola]XP_059248070.1 mitochondrial import receptor subunit TOM70 [Mustela nigripes]
MAASKPVEAAVVAAAAPSSGSGVGGGGATAGPGTGGLPRWQLALAVGAPLLLGAGAMYLWSRQRRRREAGGRGDAGGLKRNSERKTPEGRASPAPGSGHPEGTGAHLEMNSLDRAQAAKNKGNKYFKAGKYEQAIQCYTEAISLCPIEKNADLSTFYQNRAAAFEQLQKWKEVAQDCTKAVELNPKYVKALFRRAKAHEKLDNKKECLEDVTAVCILEGFQNQQSMLLADKVLKLLGKEKAKEKYKNREPLMPSPQFIKSYFSSFTDDIISQPMLKGEKSDEDKDKEGEASEVKENSGYLRAKQYMEEENYDKIISECSKEIDAQGKYMAEALLLRATFYLLIGNANAAKPDLDKVISLKEANVKLRANALIKRGSMYMQQQQPLLSTQDFNMAADIDPQNADVYHHRGQLKILLDQVEEAVADFDECIRLRPESALAQAQKCFALYRQAYTGNNSSQIQAAMKGFEEVIKKFPRCAEGYALYAQALTDQQQFGKADDMYDKCIDLEPDNATTYVHKGLLQLQWKQDLDRGLELISKAIEIDNKCDFAYETMGTIEVQRGNMEKAIDMFNKAINLAKSEMEMAHLYSLCDAAHAQTEVAKKYGLKPPTL